MNPTNDTTKPANETLASVDWAALAKLGLLARINHEILHPLGYSAFYVVENGTSPGALIAESGRWQFSPEQMALRGLQSGGPAVAERLAALRTQQPAPAGATIYVSVQECRKCGHIGINDAHPTNATCNRCEWSGPSLEEDRCPGCGKRGSMESTCPKCDGVYVQVAEKRIDAELSSIGALPLWWTQFIRNISEIADRNSPEDEPGAIVATPDELAVCALNAIENDHAPRALAAKCDQYLCKAWGETDLPIAAIVNGLDGVRAFLVEVWLGDADAVDHAGEKTLPSVMDEMQGDWEREGEAWEWSCEFEIGGISVQKVGRSDPEAATGQKHG